MSDLCRAVQVVDQVSKIYELTMAQQRERAGDMETSGTEGYLRWPPTSSTPQLVDQHVKQIAKTNEYFLYGYFKLSLKGSKQQIILLFSAFLSSTRQSPWVSHYWPTY